MNVNSSDLSNHKEEQDALNAEKNKHKKEALEKQLAETLKLKGKHK